LDKPNETNITTDSDILKRQAFNGLRDLRYCI